MRWRTRQAVRKVFRNGAAILIAGALALGVGSLLFPSEQPGTPQNPTDDSSDAELRRDIYEAAVGACSAFPPRAGETAIGAAEKYARGYQDQFEQAAFEGCLDGFREAGALP
jgi:hypothetical protein